jgi:hypothetical protein
MIALAGKRCHYCPNPATYTDRIGSTRLYVCDESDCNRQFDEEAREADLDADAFAREAAEADGFERYR